MPSGQIHGRVTVALTPVAAIGAWSSTGNVETTVLVGLGCLLGLVVEPDLDVDHQTASERRLLKTVPPLGLVWYLVWLPYAKLIPHRHWTSHWPLVGTSLRYLWLVLALTLIVAPFAFLLSVRMDTWFALLYTYRTQIGLLAVGTMVSDFGHWIMDLK